MICSAERRPWSDSSHGLSSDSGQPAGPASSRTVWRPGSVWVSRSMGRRPGIVCVISDSVKYPHSHSKPWTSPKNCQSPFSMRSPSVTYHVQADMGSK